MSRQPDPSYYEVALTSRQVAAGFVILLGCLVAAFFSGVWVGKGGAGETRAAALPAAPVAEEAPELRVIPEDAEAPAAGTATGGPGTTLAEDLAAGGSGAAARRSEPEPPAARPREPAPARPAAPAGRAPAPERRGAPAAAPATGETFVIQVLSSRDQAKARQTLTWLREGGYPASLSTVDQGGQVMYRVRVGPYRDRPTADKAADEVRRKFKLDTWVTAE